MIIISNHFLKEEFSKEVGLQIICPEEYFNKFKGNLSKKWEDFLKETLTHGGLFRAGWKFFPIVITLSCGCEKTIQKGEIKESKCKHGNYFVELILEETKLITRIMRKIQKLSSYKIIAFVLNEKDAGEIANNEFTILMRDTPVNVFGIRLFFIPGIKSKVLYTDNGSNFVEDL